MYFILNREEIPYQTGDFQLPSLLLQASNEIWYSDRQLEATSKKAHCWPEGLQ